MKLMNEVKELVGDGAYFSLFKKWIVAICNRSDENESRIETLEQKIQMLEAQIERLEEKTSGPGPEQL